MTTCGISPEKEYKGSFNIRIAPELHRKASIYSAINGESLNHFIESAVREEIGKYEAEEN